MQKREFIFVLYKMRKENRAHFCIVQNEQYKKEG